MSQDPFEGLGLGPTVDDVRATLHSSGARHRITEMREGLNLDPEARTTRNVPRSLNSTWGSQLSSAVLPPMPDSVKQGKGHTDEAGRAWHRANDEYSRRLSG